MSPPPFFCFKGLTRQLANLSSKIEKEFPILLVLPRYVKQSIMVVLDLCLLLFSIWCAFYLRIDQMSLPQHEQFYLYLFAPLLAFPLFIRFGFYRAIFRYNGMEAIFTIAKAVSLYGLMFFGALSFFKWEGVPRSIGLIQPVLLLLLISGVRVIVFFLLARFAKNIHSLKKDLSCCQGRLLIYGAGAAGVQTASALSITQEFILLGFIDDDLAKTGHTINNIPIFSPNELPEVLIRLSITDILLAVPSIGQARRNDIIARCQMLPVHVRTLPGLVDLALGRVTISDFQELNIEDLLGRIPVSPDKALLAQTLAGKTVLVTGAGGSIGSELCRQILFENPLTLILLEHNEFGLYTIHRELEDLCVERGLGVTLVPLLASISKLTRLQDICKRYRPATIYHAAAYKHVPLVESNCAEGVLNNILGTFNMAWAAMENGVQRFILISTDKAVRPTNIMGATKRVAELILQAMAASPTVTCHELEPWGHSSVTIRNTTLFSMVRFGNVLDSSGSVIPLFRRQLQAGGPLTVTHLEVTRYFMTICEAAQLVLQAGAMTQGGEVFVLDMGKPVKIINLARRMVRLSGLRIRDAAHPYGDIEIKITGLRPGEKLYEELLIGNDVEPTKHERIMKSYEPIIPWSELELGLVTLLQAAEQNNSQMIQKILSRYVQGYRQDLQSSVIIRT